MGKRAYQDWGTVERWQANTLAARMKATLPTQWARGIDALAVHEPGDLAWRRNRLWLDRLESFRAAHGDALTWHMSDSDICARAKEVAEGVATMMDLWPVPLTDDERERLVFDSCTLLDVEPPEADTQAGVIGKGKDQHWWRKRLRTKVARVVEHGAIKLGLISRNVGGYCSNAAVKRRSEQLEQQAAMMARTLLRNEAGQVYVLGELAKLGTSDRDVRRGELMVRIRGCEEFADAHGHVGLFFTLTLPSRFHAMLAPPKGSKAGARRNRKYDGSTPREGQMWLRTRWQRARAELKDAGIVMYGFRVAEPHHDGCPHWHALFWFENEDAAREARNIIRKHWLRADDHEFHDPRLSERQRRNRITAETGARKNRVCVKWMETGGAAGYVAKYVAKNVGGSYTINHLDGHTEGTPQGELFDVNTGDVPGYVRVDAWAATWGIRQFQPIGQPSVVAWRQMRRITKDQVEDARIDGDAIAWKLWGAVHKIGTIPADWRRFMEHMGGVCRQRGEWAMKVAHRVVKAVNRYGEDVQKKTAVGLELRSGRWLVARRQAWVRVADGRQDPESRAALAAPWTCFNNCRARLTGEIRRALLGRGRHEIEDWTPSASPVQAPQQRAADRSTAFPTL